MRYALFALIIGVFILVIFLLSNTDDDNLVYEPEKPGLPIAAPVANDYLHHLNDNANTIKDFQATVDADLYRPPIHVHLTGVMLFEKGHGSKITLDSPFNRECEIGSNDKQFWFYSKRMTPAALYYADNKDIYKTGLKSPFNPIWIVQSIGLDQITIPEKSLLESTDEKTIRLTITDISPSNKAVKRVFLFDKTNMLIKGSYLFNESGELNSSIEVIEYSTVKPPTPSVLKIIWIDGGKRISMNWKFSHAAVNGGMNRSWNRPTQYSPQINMATDH